MTYWSYLTTGHFYEATFENWESEFLQMAAFVVVTVYLLQRGAGESKQEADDPRDLPAPTGLGRVQAGPRAASRDGRLIPSRRSLEGIVAQFMSDARHRVSRTSP